MKKIASVIFILLFSHKSMAAIPIDGFADIVEPLMPAVVNINTVKYIDQKQKSLRTHPNMEHFNELFEHFGLPFFMDEMPTNPKATSLGSGFIIDEQGYIVTNHHVIKDADEINVKLNDNKEFKAKLIGSDQKTDIALLKIESSKSLPFVRLGDSSKVRVGDLVIAIGNPFGLGGTVTSGIVSSKARDIDILSDGLVDDYIQTDAAINGGNSGGPMFNMHGEVVGVNTAILAPTGTNIGIGFAIPSNTVKNIITQLKSSGKIERGRLGIMIQELTPEIADGLGIKAEDGVLIAGVDPGGAADKAGIKEGDVVTHFNSHPVVSSRKLQILVAETPINSEVEIKVLRKGKELTLKSKILDAKNDSKQAKTDKFGSYIVNNVKFSNLTSDISEAFAIKDTKGVVVLENASNDSWRNLHKGDLVISLNQIPVNHLDDFKMNYENAKKSGKKNIVFHIKRQNLAIFLAVPMPQ